MGLFAKFKTGLAKTHEGTIGRLAGLFRSGRINEESIEVLEDALLEADIGVETVETLIEKLRDHKSYGKDKTITPIELLRSDLIHTLGNKSESLTRFSETPWDIILVGVNGSGKTTTAGKLAYYYSLHGKKVVVAAADTFRAAAIEQLEEWTKRGDARLVKADHGADPAALVFDAYQSAIARGDDLLIVDTAGRLQAYRNLMEELGKINRVLRRIRPSAPHEVLLVIDSTTGQNAVSQARGFSSVVGVTGLIVTKLDGSARGGVVVPIHKELGLPIAFVGMGEGVDDLHPFNAEVYVNALLDG
ncbi:MAG: signal recognition particle-docking protein FtsY [Candidatus Electryoneaceae bacterium]|nr:signal recognition particle-docking protein FtsY [Candidatus Electryoneaceae bacterium]